MATNTTPIATSGNIGAVILDALVYRLWPSLSNRAMEMWDWAWNSDEIVESRTLVKNALRGKTLANQLRRAAFFGFGLIIVGQLIGRYGYANQPADALGHGFWNTVSNGIRSFGSCVRGLGTLYAVYWLGIIVLKSEALIKGLSLVSSAFDRVREVLAALAPDALGLDAIITKGKVLSEEKGREERNMFLSLFIWIVTFGVFTQMDSVFPVDISLGSFIALVCAAIALYAISVYLGVNHIKIAMWINIIAVVGLLLGLFVNSFAYAKAEHWYTGTDSYRSSALQEATKRVLAGNQEPGDEKLLGNAYSYVVAVRDFNMGTDKSDCARKNAAADMITADAIIKGEVSTAEFMDCTAIAKAEQAKADVAKAVHDQANARREAVARVISKLEKKGDKEILDGIYPDLLEARKLEARTNNDECHQARLAALHKRIKLFEAGKDFDGVVLTQCQPAASNPPPASNPPAASPGAGNKAASVGKPMTEDQIAKEALRQTMAKFGNAL